MVATEAAIAIGSCRPKVLADAAYRLAVRVAGRLLVEIEHGCGDLIVPRLDGDNGIVHRAVPSIRSPAALDLLDSAPVTSGAMIWAPEKAVLRRETSREVSDSRAYFLEPNGGFVEVVSHRRRQLVDAQLVRKLGVCELLAGELAELVIKLKHKLR